MEVEQPEDGVTTTKSIVNRSPASAAGKRTRRTERFLKIDDESEVTLADLLDSELVHMRDKITFLGRSGMIVREGWIEDLDLGDTFPELSTWIQRVCFFINQLLIQSSV